ncbi:sterol desaturase family protein [Phragmitibacter flavus]|uniref:Sterol desaturase family protein n=1 Tax=Phragmitibacter flavus TaxID=2576071 RepID=A0A5R8KE22_9BACT|nr:sterol desaturase family protein [Phragmitibacter flavus]TLD70564.1 sterol desaturase family protein [Phragmitibacter flavus]
MQSFLFWSAVGFAISVVMTSFFEWAIHRFVMHKPVGKFDYAFRAHAVVHHKVFKADHTYHLVKESDKETIPMAWWNGPVLIMLAQIPMLPVALLAGQWAILAGSLTAVTGYYVVYEYIHWCMHLPRKRHIERSGIFFRLNGHHLLHHRYMHKNFNVVFPLADFFMGTLLLRSKIKFAQARGPSVPNVQPHAEVQPPTDHEAPEGAALPAPGI